MNLHARRAGCAVTLAWLAAWPIVACGSSDRAEFASSTDASTDVAQETTAPSVDGAPDGAPSGADSGTDAESTHDAENTDAESTDSGVDAVSPSDASLETSTPDTGTSSDAASTPETSVDASSTKDASSDTGATSDAAGDAGSPSDASADATDGSASVDPFGTSCGAPTVYTDTFLTNPLTAGWQTIVGNVTYQVTDAGAGLLVLAEGSPNTQAWIGARPAWTDYTVSVPVRIDAAGASANGGINFRMESVGTANDSGQMYFAGITPTAVILGVENGSWTLYDSVPGTFSTGVFYTLTLTATGNSFSVSATGTGSGNPSINYSNAGAGASTNFLTGSFGFRTFDMGMSFGPITVTCN